MQVFCKTRNLHVDLSFVLTLFALVWKLNLTHKSFFIFDRWNYSYDMLCLEKKIFHEKKFSLAKCKWSWALICLFDCKILEGKKNEYVKSEMKRKLYSFNFSEKIFKWENKNTFYPKFFPYQIKHLLNITTSYYQL